MLLRINVFLAVAGLLGWLLGFPVRLLWLKLGLPAAPWLLGMLPNLLALALTGAAWWRGRPQLLPRGDRRFEWRAAHAVLLASQLRWVVWLLAGLGMHGTSGFARVLMVWSWWAPALSLVGLGLLGLACRRGNDEASPTTPAADRWTERTLRVASVLAVLNLPVAAVAVLSGFGFLAYGLAHAGGAKAAVLIVVLLLAFGALAVGPFLVFGRPGRPAKGFTRVLGGMLLLVSLGLGIQSIWFTTIEPALLNARFDHAVSRVQVKAVETVPLRLGAVPVGVRVHLLLEVTDPIGSDEVGLAARRMLDGLQLVQEPAITPSNRVLPFSHSYRPSDLQLNGQPLQRDPTNRQPLVAGRYRMSNDFLFLGLRQGRDGIPHCRLQAREAEPADGWPAFAAQLPGGTLNMAAVVAGNLGLSMRRGNRFAQRQSETFSVRFDAIRWPQQLAALPVETCDAQDTRLAAEAAAAKAATHAQRYAAGDAGLNLEDNPLYKELCAHDVAAVKARLAVAAPRRDVAHMVRDCTLTRWHPELHELMLPVLYARVEERAAYCDMLEPALAQRRVGRLEQLQRLGLPPMCATDKHLSQVLYPGEHNHNLPRVAPNSSGTIEWLQQLQALGADICATSDKRSSLVQLAAPLAEAVLLQYLLDAGCDPLLLPAYGHVGTAQSAALSLAARRFAHADEPHAPRLEPLPEALVQRFGDVTDEEIRRIEPGTGRGVLSRSLGFFYSGPLLAHLVQRGAALDAADDAGSSWYWLGNLSGARIAPQQLASLDVLSVEQLRVLIKPVVTRTGQPGKPMRGAEDRHPGSFGAYLCSRGAVSC